jgi:two-component system, sensor histidine kinase and response regulator
MDTSQLLTQLPDCVLVLNGSGHVLWGNRAAERLFGRLLRDSIGFPALDLVHPDDLELVLRSFESVQRKEIGTLIEVRAKTPSGWRLLEVLGTPISWPDESGTVLFCMRDLSERRRFELARDQDATFRAVVQNSPDMTILLTSSGYVSSVSGALSRILGHDPEAIEGRPLVQIVIEEDRRAFLASLQMASRGATPSEPLKVRVRLTRRETGEPVPFEFRLVNLLDDPSVSGFVVSAHDITSQVAGERELYLSEQRFRSVFDQSPAGIVLTDCELRVVDANKAFCQMIGDQEENVVGKTLQSFLHPDDREAIQTSWVQLFEHPALNNTTEYRFTSDGRGTVVATTTASVISEESGIPLHCLWIIEDGTGRTSELGYA